MIKDSILGHKATTRRSRGRFPAGWYGIPGRERVAPVIRRLRGLRLLFGHQVLINYKRLGFIPS
jgi:hypothetical protein